MESKTEQVGVRTRTVKNGADGFGDYARPRNVFVNQKNGKRYCYYRKRGHDLIALPNLPYSHPNFVSAYEEAVIKTGGALVGGMEVSLKNQTSAYSDAMSSALAVALKKARDRAVARDLAFNLTEESIADLYAAQGGKCALTGAALSPHGVADGMRNPTRPSIDRVDRTLGYIKGNVRITTHIANVARADFGDDAFYSMCVAGAVKAAKRR